MKSAQPSGKAKKPAEEKVEDLAAQLAQKVVGQTAVSDIIIPYIQMFQAGLAPEGRPVGVFLLLGPTGTGKTKTVEALAEILHGSEKNVLKVDCGEFQMEHEVAKLIGAPPGYLGHRETQPMLTQQKLNAVTSDRCGLSLVLFDEIEKAAPSLTRLLLGVLDKGVLRLGDNSTVNFEKSLVFLTSNLGAREMMKEINPDFGFGAGAGMERSDLTSKLQNIALVAVRKKFSPEFVNRIDCVITYQPLTPESLSAILDHQISDLQNHVNTRLGPRCFTIEVPFETRLRRQGLVGDNAIDAVDKLGRKLLSYRDQSYVLELARQVGALGRNTGLEAEVGADLFHHFARAQIARKENQALFEIHGRVIAQPQDAFIQNAEQQPR